MSQVQKKSGLISQQIGFNAFTLSSKRLSYISNATFTLIRINSFYGQALCESVKHPLMNRLWGCQCSPEEDGEVRC